MLEMDAVVSVSVALLLTVLVTDDPIVSVEPVDAVTDVSEVSDVDEAEDELVTDVAVPAVVEEVSLEDTVSPGSPLVAVGLPVATSEEDSVVGTPLDKEEFDGTAVESTDVVVETGVAGPVDSVTETVSPTPVVELASDEVELPHIEEMAPMDARLASSSDAS